jgi:hypothetical protein
MKTDSLDSMVLRAAGVELVIDKTEADGTMLVTKLLR